jgi:hypothetical protein
VYVRSARTEGKPESAEFLRKKHRQRATVLNRRAPAPSNGHPSMDYYYTDAQNQPRGPVSVEQLRELLNSGAVNASTQVAAVGSQQWVPILTVVQASAAPGGTAGPGPVMGAPGGAMVPAGPTEPLAVWSLVLGIISMICCTFMIFGIGAVVTGHLALGSIKKSPNRQGRGMALAGLIMGYISIVSGILGIAFGILGQILEATKH